MIDIRMQTARWDFDGHSWELRCNMNVIAEAQEAVGGVFARALASDTTFRGALIFLAAMLNDYADEQGWPERYSAKELGRRLSWAEYNSVSDTVMRLVSSALTPGEDAGEKPEEPEGDEKN